jgi:hypothetical protein
VYVFRLGWASVHLVVIQRAVGDIKATTVSAASCSRPSNCECSAAILYIFHLNLNLEKRPTILCLLPSRVVVSVLENVANAISAHCILAVSSPADASAEVFKITCTTL